MQGQQDSYHTGITHALTGLGENKQYNLLMYNIFVIIICFIYSVMFIYKADHV